LIGPPTANPSSETADDAPLFRAPDGPYDPQGGRDHHRLTTVRATDLVLPKLEDAAELYLGRLTPYYHSASPTLPTRTASAQLQVTSCSGQRSHEIQPALRQLAINIFQTPNGRIVYGVTLDAAIETQNLVAFLEDGYYESISLQLTDGTPTTLAAEIDRRITQLAGQTNWNRAPDIHQLLYLSPQLSGLRVEEGRLELKEEFLRSLVYRVHGPLREGFTSIAFPSELNRGMATIGAVGTFVSVLSGHQDYAENAYLLSAVMTTSATAELRDVQASILRSFTDVRDRLGTLERPEQRPMLGQISGNLAQHEMSLSQNVESASDIGLWIPSLRVENYHRTLVAAVRLSERSQLIANSLRRLTALVAARTQVLIAQEQQLQEHRRRSWTLIVGLLTSVAIPVSLILAFFGISATQVDPKASIFDLHRYLGVYLSAFGMIGLSGLAVTLFWFIGHPRRRENDPDP
jgi:hypothetical protein